MIEIIFGIIILIGVIAILSKLFLPVLKAGISFVVIIIIGLFIYVLIKVL